MTHARCTFALGLALALWGSLALSQNPTAAPARTEQEQAEAHFQRGRAMEEGGRAAEAIAEYRRAIALEETPAGYVRLGGALRTLGRYRDAIVALERALALTREDPEGYGALSHAASATIAELRGSLGYWSVSTTPLEADVNFDGVTVTEPNRWHEADPGSHVLVVQSPGYRTATRSITLASGVREALTVVLPAHRAAVGSHGVDSERRRITESPWFWAGALGATAGLIVGAVLLFSTTEPEFRGTFYGTVPSGIMVGP